MKTIVRAVSALLVTAYLLSVPLSGMDFPVLTGPYLGQAPPGRTPELFAAGLVSLGYQEQKIAISPDGSEIYFTVVAADRSTLQIVFTRLEHGAWTAPRPAPFSDAGINLHPAFSPDGKRLFFTSTRGGDSNTSGRNSMDIWLVERSGGAWSEPVNVGGGVNTERQEACPSVAADGTLFFETNVGPDPRDWNVYVSRPRNGVYQKAERVPSPISSEHNDGGPCISRDGSYLLFFSNRPGTVGSADLYVVYRRKDGAWGEAFNLGSRINSRYVDRTPTVSPDGKYLFFTSGRNLEPIAPRDCAYTEKLKRDLGTPKPGDGSLYWVDARIIAELRPPR